MSKLTKEKLEEMQNFAVEAFDYAVEKSNAIQSRKEEIEKNYDREVLHSFEGYRQLINQGIENRRDGVDALRTAVLIEQTLKNNFG